MSVSTRGIIKGRQIHLDRKPGLPDGARVRVRIEVQPKVLVAKRRLAARLFGSCAEDPTFAKAVAKIERQRHLNPPRKGQNGTS